MELFENDIRNSVGPDLETLFDKIDNTPDQIPQYEAAAMLKWLGELAMKDKNLCLILLIKIARPEATSREIEKMLSLAKSSVARRYQVALAIHPELGKIILGTHRHRALVQRQRRKREKGESNNGTE